MCAVYVMAIVFLILSSSITKSIIIIIRSILIIYKGTDMHHIAPPVTGTLYTLMLRYV